MGERMTTPAALLTPGEVANVLRVSVQSCYGPLRTMLPWLKIRGSLRMRPSDLENWLNEHRQAA